jgi:addiction module RelE/StbE family toxin
MENQEGYDLDFTPEFLADYKKLIKKTPLLKKKFTKALKLLANNPKHGSLKSHKVDTINNQDVWSSWVTGDVRVIWMYDEDQKMIIILLEAGTHSGGNKVYK